MFDDADTNENSAAAMMQWQNILTFWDLMGDVPEYREITRDDFAEVIQNTPTAKKRRAVEDAREEVRKKIKFSGTLPAKGR
ncbi:hypothetical protein BDDG_11896 [Blastomyces dermatitidis ATCC 18188]|uniref:Uncharacterized protein n=1 Tax=Ajellomyces dermatitidis (strain ATCC 18188 / CBS 674.68) TaxID=653446 RepID=A0A0J9EPD7_AJEDA|nr:hypothetical protein BDDG_11896 [Blastomyces dermatitidis ATCC 18188]